MDAELLTVSQAAEHLHASTQTIRNWIREERLSAVRIGNRFLIPRTEVQRLLGEESTSTRGESPWDFDMGEPSRPLPRAAERQALHDPDEAVLGG
ncbi:MAG: helix-turn-helix domain-containing protein [Solirubrobacteraceae bacterium]